MKEEDRTEFHRGRGKRADSWVMRGSLPANVLRHSRAKQGRSPTFDDVIGQVCGKYGIERNALKMPGEDDAITLRLIPGRYVR
ncbi:MAG: hypothetical protein AB9866_04045 [Syntrophobacteraceae bacterium]